jgi:hypothetical protein
MERYKDGENGNSNYKKPTFEIPSPRFDKIDKQKVFEHAEFCDKLPQGHFCLTYLEKRKVPKARHPNIARDHNTDTIVHFFCMEIMV